MNSTIIVMLIWIGSYQGGPATIQGFKTLHSCETAAAKFREDGAGFWSWGNAILVRCIELSL